MKNLKSFTVCVVLCGFFCFFSWIRLYCSCNFLQMMWFKRLTFCCLPALAAGTQAHLSSMCFFRVLKCWLCVENTCSPSPTQGCAKYTYIIRIFIALFCLFLKTTLWFPLFLPKRVTAALASWYGIVIHQQCVYSPLVLHFISPQNKFKWDVVVQVHTQRDPSAWVGKAVTETFDSVLSKWNSTIS